MASRVCLGLEELARLLARLGLRYVNARLLARLMGLPAWRAGQLLAEMAERGLAVLERDGTRVYRLLVDEEPLPVFRRPPVGVREPVPAPGRGPLRVVTVKLGEGLLQRIDDARVLLGWPHRSDVIRKAVIEFLERRGLLPVHQPTSSGQAIELEIEA
ncbi:hypothetical protein [Pyrodictium abyssi]|uniref:Ribbon-helix-helix protein CopG domain-containing protein n=1 Tax=Pyrodictium abyssi TaxID=54256 RepID=A0ABN6ZT37_9CREN|nr:hypothetical protein PABY_08290 [Pyrodictium abyssi]